MLGMAKRAVFFTVLFVAALAAGYGFVYWVVEVLTVQQRYLLLGGLIGVVAFNLALVLPALICDLLERRAFRARRFSHTV